MKRGDAILAAATLALVAMATLTIGGDARYTYSKLGNFYYYTEPMEAAMQRVHYSAAGAAGSSEAMPPAYQKYVACVARTFFFRACTLCFCTDVPSVALCWDYASDRCAETRRLVDLQLNARNNEPSGVW